MNLNSYTRTISAVPKIRVQFLFYYQKTDVRPKANKQDRETEWKKLCPLGQLVVKD